MADSKIGKIAKTTTEEMKGTNYSSSLNDLSNIPLWQLTVQEFENLMGRILSEFFQHDEMSARDPPRMVYGLDGLCEVLGCSKSTAMRLKKSGVLDESMVQTGRKIIIDAEKVLQILSNNKKSKK